MPDKCKKCQANITGTTVKFQGDPYHPECFLCHQCRKQLSGKEIYTHDGHWYDKDCYSLFHAKKCAVCYKPLVEAKVKYVEYDNKHYHPDCFTCYKCRESLAGSKFVIEGGEKYHEHCC